MKTTPWFNFATPPRRHGFYEFSFSRCRWNWDGRKWASGPGITLIAAPINGKWRGLAEKP